MAAPGARSAFCTGKAILRIIARRAWLSQEARPSHSLMRIPGGATLPIAGTNQQGRSAGVDFPGSGLYPFSIMTSHISPYTQDIACFISAEERYWRSKL